jgi:hypothetical protein
MIKHVVMWKMRGPSFEEKHEQAKRVRAALIALQGKIPGMTELEVGLGPGGAEEVSDVVLITTHEDWKALEEYQNHPDHKVAAQLIGELRVERRVVDFEV